MPLTRRLVRRVLAIVAVGRYASSLDVLLALVGELDWASDERDEDGAAEDEGLCSTC